MASDPVRDRVTVGPSSPAPRVLAVDFDGVLCDSLDECVLISWNSFFDCEIASPTPQSLGVIPLRYIDRFREMRGYGRHLGHFLMPLLGGADLIRSQIEFDHCFASLPTEAVRQFAAGAEDYRSALRERYPEQWAALHRVYPAVTAVVAGRNPYVVTARDARSVVDVMTTNGVTVDPARIYGGCRDKVAALRDIARRECVEPGEVLFVDDNLPNVASARQGGFAARWATWGFTVPEHFEEAARAGIEGIDMETFGLIAAGFGPVDRSIQPVAAPRPDAADDREQRNAMRVAVMMADGFDDREFRQPVDRLRAAGHDVVVVGSRKGAVLRGKLGQEQVSVDRECVEVSALDFDAVLIPGGHSPDRLRVVPSAVQFVREMHAAGKITAAICHGPWLLIEADIVAGRAVTGWASVRTDVVNAGGRWVDAAVVVDGNLLTSRQPDDLAAFGDAVVMALAGQSDRGPAR